MSLSRSASRRITLFVLSLALAVLSLLATATPAAAQATVIQTNTRVPIDFIATSCSGEQVIISGESHIVVHATGSPGGTGTTTTHINFHLQGTSASGTLYNANETLNGTEVSHANGQTVFENVAQLNLVSQGSTDNLRIRTVIRTIVNSNGEVTSTTFEFTVECNG
jgi:hypothetical protein